MHTGVIKAVTLALACTGALAQDTGAPADQPATTTRADKVIPPDAQAPASNGSIETSDKPWSFSIEPGAWFVGAGGRLRMPRTAPPGTPNPKVGIENLNLDNPRFVPFGEVNARKDEWRLALRGFYYDADKNSSGNSGQVGDLIINPSDTIRSSMRFASYELEAAYTVAGTPQNKYETGSFAIDPKLDAVAGVRLYDVNWTLRSDATGAGVHQVSDDGLFLQPEVGGKLNLDFGTDFTIDLQVTLGGLPFGSGTSYSGDIIVGLQYHPTPYVGVQIGYRSLFFGVSKGSGAGEFGFNGAMQGLYGSLVFRF